MSNMVRVKIVIAADVDLILQMLDVKMIREMDNPARASTFAAIKRLRNAKTMWE